MIDNNKWVEKILANKKIALIGYADLSEIESGLRRGFQYGIVFAMSLNVLPSVTNEPSIEYYNDFIQVSVALKTIGSLLSEKIIERGFNAYALFNDKQNNDFRTPLPFKTLATRAGIGWIGKSAALITKKYGNAIRLGGVLTDMPLVTGTPINSSLCGDCMECVDNCPGKAIRGNLWELKSDRSSLLNAQECKKAVIERGKIFDVREGTCGICITVCPYTKKYAKNYLRTV